MQRGLVSVVHFCLGAERAQQLITLCANSRTPRVESDFAVTLKVVEDLSKYLQCAMLTRADMHK